MGNIVMDTDVGVDASSFGDERNNGKVIDAGHG